MLLLERGVVPFFQLVLVHHTFHAFGKKLLYMLAELDFDLLLQASPLLPDLTLVVVGLSGLLRH